MLGSPSLTGIRHAGSPTPAPRKAKHARPIHRILIKRCTLARHCGRRRALVPCSFWKGAGEIGGGGGTCALGVMAGNPGTTLCRPPVFQRLRRSRAGAFVVLAGNFFPFFGDLELAFANPLDVSIVDVLRDTPANRLQLNIKPSRLGCAGH